MNKTLILVRHAHALSRYEASVPTDGERPLCAQGEQKALQTAQDLLGRKIVPQQIFTSPLLRAVQTAQILNQTLQAPVTPENILDGFHPDEEVKDFLMGQMQRHNCLIAVGHNPCITYVTALLSGQVRPFSPGSFAVLDIQDTAVKLVYFGV
jgi:phosphohistidine phosphatase